MMTRRVLLFNLTGAGLQAAVSFDHEMRQGKTAIRLIDATEDPTGAFFVGVRTSVKAEYFFAEVFYRVPYPAANGGSLLLHQESLGPVAGNLGYGASNQSFTMPRDSVELMLTE